METKQHKLEDASAELLYGAAVVFQNYHRGLSGPLDRHGGGDLQRESLNGRRLCILK